MPRAQRTPTNAASKGTILVVDDSPLCRELTAASLRATGFKTLESSDGLAALALLAEQHVDLIILDNEMPRMGGLEFLKALRAEPRWKRVPVLLLTATASKEAVVQGDAAMG